MSNDVKKPADAKAAAPAKSTPEEKVRVDKAARFKELAPRRTRVILKGLDVLSNCSNRSGYDYKPEDIVKIFAAIEKKVADVKAKFSQTSKEKEILFDL